MTSPLHNVGSWTLRRAQIGPDHLAAVDAERSLDYRALHERAGRCAALLAARGVGAGDRVALLLGNRTAYLELVFAAARIGAIAVPLNARLTAPELRGLLADCTPALLVHECFHVHQKAAHPDWTANEAELFTYPVDDATILAERRQETLALVRALQARKDEDARCWARSALAVRGKRAASLPEGALAYERGIEKNEGLAQYVEDLSLHAGARLTDADFPAEEIRQRGYGTGQAWALLLDRFGDWKAGLGATPLDEVLRARLGSEGAVCALSPDAIRSATARAERDAAEVLASRGTRRSAFLAAPGWTVEIVAGGEPLWPQGFDPWNVKNLGERVVLHTRWVKVGNGAGSVEVLDRPSLTEGLGPHPLFNGARRLVVTGLAEPALTEGEGQVGIEAKGLKGSFRGRVERGERRIRLLLP